MLFVGIQSMVGSGVAAAMDKGDKTQISNVLAAYLGCKDKVRLDFFFFFFCKICHSTSRILR